MTCTEDKHTGHLWWECEDEAVMAGRIKRHPSLYRKDVVFDTEKDELLFERDGQDLFNERE